MLPSPATPGSQCCCVGFDLKRLIERLLHQVLAGPFPIDHQKILWRERQQRVMPGAGAKIHALVPECNKTEISPGTTLADGGATATR